MPPGERVDRVQLEWSARVEVPDLVGAADAVKRGEFLLREQEVDQRAAAARQAARVPGSSPFDAKPRAEHFAKVPPFRVGNEAKSLDDVANVFSHAAIAQGLGINMIFSHDACGGSRRCLDRAARVATDGIPRHAQAPRLVVRLDRRARRARRRPAVGVGLHLPPTERRDTYRRVALRSIRRSRIRRTSCAPAIAATSACSPVYGDQWRVDAEFLKWKYWALLLGLDSQYRLDRLEGRYRSVVDQNSQPKLAHDLRDETAVDVVSLAEGLGRWNFLIDASYGSSTYQDIDPANVYTSTVRRRRSSRARSRDPCPSRARRSRSTSTEHAARRSRSGTE